MSPVLDPTLLELELKVRQIVSKKIHKLNYRALDSRQKQIVREYINGLSNIELIRLLGEAL